MRPFPHTHQANKHVQVDRGEEDEKERAETKTTGSRGEKEGECNGEVVDRGRKEGESERERKGRRYEVNLVFLVWFD